jgi:SEC-C motif
VGKASRNKKQQAKWVHRAADEVFSSGPLTIERFGNLVRYSNNATREQHAELLSRATTANKELHKDLSDELTTLQGLLKHYDPVQMLHRAAYMLLPVLIKHRSENEYTSEEAFFLPAVEYLQYLVARTDISTDSRTPTEDEWQQLWEQTLKVLRITQSYLLTRPPRSTPPSPIDELRFVIDNRRLGVRIHRYSIFFADHLRTYLAPYDVQISTAYGVGAEEIISDLQKIENYERFGLIDQYRKSFDLTESLMNKLQAKGYDVGRDASAEEAAKIQAALASSEFRDLHHDVQSQVAKTFTPELFDITDLTSIPRPLLSLLSVKPSESLLTSLTGPNHDDLSPLSQSALHYKPFLEAGGRFYNFCHSGLQDRVAEIIESNLFQIFPNKVPELAKRRSDRLEAESRQLLSIIFRFDFAEQNVYYPNPDDPGNLTELDLLLGIDDLLFLVEVKAGGFSKAASRGAPESIAEELSDLIVDGQRQSERAERYLKAQPEAPFYDETGKRELLRVKHSEYRRMFRIVVTREDLGWVGARIAILSILDPRLISSQPWHVSIDDLRAISVLFEADELRFAHYLERRLDAAAEPTLAQHDEMEHVGLYYKKNYYHRPIAKGLDRMSFDASFMRDIDYYFAEKAAGGSPEVPTQGMPTEMRALLNALRDCRLQGRFAVASMILSMSTSARTDFERSLLALKSALRAARERTLALSFGLSITYASDSLLQDVLIKAAAQMTRGGLSRWMVVQLAHQQSFSVKRIETIIPSRFTETEIQRGDSMLLKSVSEAASTKQTKRNSPCPCGSGKKFKKCHGGT